MDLKNIRLEGDLKDHNLSWTQHVLCLFIKVSLWLMCLLMHFFGIFSIKRLKDALKLILTLIMILILVSGMQFSCVLVVLTLLGYLCMVLSNTFTLCFSNSGNTFSWKHPHFILKHVLKFIWFVRINLNSFLESLPRRWLVLSVKYYEVIS